jgi:hypothetical protein
MTEEEMRDADVPTLETLEELTAYISELVNQPQDYGTCVYAMSMAATATFNYVARNLGVTGFQASCADMDILRRTRDLEGPFMLVKGENLLYPQYDIQSNVQEWIGSCTPWAAQEAKKLLASANPENVAYNVWRHWERLASAGEELDAPETYDQGGGA